MDSGVPIFGGQWDNINEEEELTSTEQCEVPERASGFYAYLKELEPGSYVTFFAEIREDKKRFTGYLKGLYGMGSGIVVALHSYTISAVDNISYPQQQSDPKHECIILISRIIDGVSIRKQKSEESNLEDVRKLDLD